MLLESCETAHAHFQTMPLSVQKACTYAYLNAKTEVGQEAAVRLDGGPALSKSETNVTNTVT